MKKVIILLTITLGVIIGCKKEVSNDFIYRHEFVQRDYLPMVEGTLNGKKAYFLLDTGASVSILDLKASSMYGVNDLGEDDIPISGYGGTSTGVSRLSNVDVKLGNLKSVDKFLGKDIGYLIKTIKNATGYQIVGIIGNNNIAGDNMILDFENNMILKRK